MEKNDTPANEQESLRIIEQMISRVKSDVRDNSFMYLLWGWFVFAASIGNYILQFVMEYDKPWLPWMILMPLGGVIAGIYGSRERKQRKQKTYVNEFLGYLVVAFLVSLFVVLFFMFKLRENCYPLVMLIYGIWLFVSGGVIQFRPLVIGGLINWAFAIGSFFLDFQFQLVALAAAVLLGYIIPGYLLKAQFRKSV